MIKWQILILVMSIPTWLNAEETDPYKYDRELDTLYASDWNFKPFKSIRNKQKKHIANPLKHQRNYYKKFVQLTGEEVNTIEISKFYNANVNLDASEEFLKAGIDLKKFANMNITHYDYKYNILLRQTVIEGTVVAKKSTAKRDEQGLPPGIIYTIHINDLLTDIGFIQVGQTEVYLNNMGSHHEARISVGDKCMFLLSHSILYDEEKDKYNTPYYYYTAKSGVKPIKNGKVEVAEDKFISVEAFKDTARMIQKINDYEKFFDREYK